MIGREEKMSNDLFYLCSLIEYISRKTKNKNSSIVNKIGKENLQKIYELADVYHSESLENVCSELIEIFNIKNGSFDNISTCRYSIPSHFDIGKVYKRLILGVSKDKKIDIIDALTNVYNSFVSEKIEDYNWGFYYDAPQNILNAYIDGKIE